MRLSLLPKSILWIAGLLSSISGCDDRATQIAREAADRQAQQNTVMAELNKEVAAGTHKLIESDAQARKDVVGVHRDLQAERTRLDTSWSSLESERKEIATQRRTESTLVSMTTIGGSILLGAVVLGFCWFLLIAAHRDTEGLELTELLVKELMTEQPSIAGETGNCSVPISRLIQTRRTPLPPHPSGKTPETLNTETIYMVNLVLHCGARHVERRAIEKSPTPLASQTWVPVPHHRLLEQVESTITGNGLTVINQAHALWQDGQRYFGLLEVANGESHADYGLVIGLRNSHDKSFPAAIAMGSCCFYL